LGVYTDGDGKINAQKWEVPCVVPHELNWHAKMINWRPRNDAFAGARVASVGGVVFGVRWLDTAIRFCVSFDLSNGGGCRNGAEEPNQSGVEPPHSKESYLPMGHGKASPGNSGRFGCPQKEFGRNACQWQDVRDTMREAETAANSTLEERHDR